MSYALPQLIVTDRPAALPRHDGRLWSRRAAAATALLAHAALLGVLVQSWQRPLPPPADPLGFRMIIAPPRAVPAPGTPPQALPPVEAEHSAPPRLEAAIPLPAPPVQLSRLQPVRVPPLHRAAKPRVLASVPHPPVASPPAAPLTATRDPAPPSGGDSPAEARAEDADTELTLGRLQTEISDAVRAASHMPAAAVRQHRQGRARVAFTYMDGFVQAASVVESSTSRLLDDAALAAVRTAQYPAPPPRARGHRLSMLVWIDFRIAPEG